MPFFLEWWAIDSQLIISSYWNLNHFEWTEYSEFCESTICKKWFHFISMKDLSCNVIKKNLGTCIVGDNMWHNGEYMFMYLWTKSDMWSICAGKQTTCNSRKNHTWDYAKIVTVIYYTLRIPQHWPLLWQHVHRFVAECFTKLWIFGYITFYRRQTIWTHSSFRLRIILKEVAF